MAQIIPAIYTGDYDEFNTEDEVIELLMKGNLKEDAKQ